MSSEKKAIGKLTSLMISDRSMIYYPSFEKDRGSDIAILFDLWFYILIRANKISVRKLYSVLSKAVGIQALTGSRAAKQSQFHMIYGSHNQ